MKIGVVGKGGTGKTTTSALLARAYAHRGAHVVAVDTDSNPNLGMSLGVDEATAAQAPLVPRELVIGSGDDDTPQRLLADYGVATPAGVTLLHAVRVEEAGGGCMCGSHASVRSLLGSTVDEHVGVTIVDMEAGLEHLSRSGGTLAYVDVLLIVTEPTHKAALTAARTVDLARELGILRIALVANKADPNDTGLLDDTTAELGTPLAGMIPADPEVMTADRTGGPLPVTTVAGRAIDDVVAFIESAEEERTALLAEKARVDAKLAALGDA